MQQMEFNQEGFHPPKAGIYLLYGCVALLFFLFLLRFWYLQVLRGADYARQATANRLRQERIYANRGLLFDARGEILAENRPAYCIALVRDDCPDIPGTLAQISQWAGIPLEELQGKYEQERRKVQSFEPHILVSDISFESLSKIEPRLQDWPGTSIIIHQRRHYPQGPLFAHILGYVAEADAGELESDHDLAPGDIIGKQGLELRLENFLRGSKGLQEMEVDVRGRQLTSRMLELPRGGENMALTLDTEIQLAAAEALGEEAGTIVVMDPDTGRIHALLSKPFYDNNAFAARLSHAEWNALLNNPRHPLLNRSIQSVYPPGSIWKLMMAGLILSEGINPEETVFCNGAMKLGNRTFRCWRAGGHGHINLENALASSCDVYFYHMGDRLGIDKIAAYARACGFGDTTGIILPHEQKGLVPDRAWRRARGESWQGGETLNVSIGQGATLVTPLQMASFVSALLNEGKIMRPTLLAGFEPEVRDVLPMSQETVRFIVNAMRRTVEAPSGTARRLLRRDAVMGGKTGTAQVVRIGEVRLENNELAYEHRDHAWMVSWGEKRGRRYVVIVMLEHAGGGSAAAGPVAKLMYDKLFGPDEGPISIAAAPASGVTP